MESFAVIWSDSSHAPRVLRIGSVNGVGALSELAERLGRLTATHLAV
jgi:hypothetical protein